MKNENDMLDPRVFLTSKRYNKPHHPPGCSHLQTEVAVGSCFVPLRTNQHCITKVISG